jgi:hypothetical protein
MLSYKSKKVSSTSQKSLHLKALNANQHPVNPQILDIISTSLDNHLILTIQKRYNINNPLTRNGNGSNPYQTPNP